MKKLLFLLIIVTGFVFSGIAQTKTNTGTELIPIDPNVKIGKLDNGLVYYIQKNSKPEKRVELRLAVNTGSVMEDDAELGLAHFTEHMCFNGTKTFPKNELVSSLEKIGIKFGEDLNAYTGFDETVYMLKMPTDNPELIIKGMQILEDWAHQVTFEDAEIDKERGVIVEELRLGLGADDRMRKKAFPVIFAGSKYAQRLPIGTKENLETFKYETIRNFYKKWYRPNLQAIVVVGDINVAEMEQMIIKQFGAIKNPANEAKRVDIDVPDNDKPLISIETDPEASGNDLMFFYKHPKRSLKTVNEYRESVKSELYTTMMDSRLEEIASKSDAPFIQAGTSYGDFLARSQDAFLGYCSTKENKLAESFDVVLTELERVKRFGFTATELERAKKNLMIRYERNAKEFDKIESGRIAMKFVYNFLASKPIPSPVQEFDMVTLQLPTITIEEINALSAKWITEKNMVIMVTAPQKPDITVPTKEQLIDVIAAVSKKELKPYVDSNTDSPLVNVEIQQGKVDSEEIVKEIDATVLTLSNGAKVILKKTDFKNNEVLFTAFSNGGHSLYPVADFMSANYASAIMDESGLGTFNKTDLGKKLAGKDLSVNSYITDLKEGLNGKFAPQDMETAFQMIYLNFTQPRKDQEAYNAFLSKTKSQLKFFANNPMYAFYKVFFETLTMNDPRSIVIPTVEQLDQINLDKAFSIYQDRFADAGDFTFVFVGNFDLETIKPFINQYIASLPATGRKETFKDVSPKFPEKTTEVVFNKGIDEKGMIGLAMKSGFEWNEKSKIELYALNQVLNIKLRESIREDEGGTYGIGIQMVPEKYPVPEVASIIVFGCDPKKQEKYVKIILSEMQKVMKNGPTAEDLAKVKETILRERETNLKKNDWWKSKIENIYYYNDPLSSVSSFVDNVNGLTIESIKKMAEKSLTPGLYVQVFLKPEGKK